MQYFINTEFNILYNYKFNIFIFLLVLKWKERYFFYTSYYIASMFVCQCAHCIIYKYMAETNIWSLSLTKSQRRNSVWIWYTLVEESLSFLLNY